MMHQRIIKGSLCPGTWQKGSGVRVSSSRFYTADDDLFTNKDDLGHEETISSSTSISKHSQAFVLWCFSMYGHCWVLHCHHSTARHLQVDRETRCTHGYMSSSQRISLWVLCALEKGSMLFGGILQGVCKGHHGMCSRSPLWSIMVFLWRQLLFQIADGWWLCPW